MKPITLHPGSLLAGIGVAVLAFVAMGQQVVKLPPQGLATGETEMPTRPPAFAIHPRDYVQIVQGVPYVVPTGKIFFLTAVGSIQDASRTFLHVDGQRELTCDNGWAGGSFENRSPSVLPVPKGLTVYGGSTIDLLVTGPSGPVGRAWGYLVND